MSTDSRTSYVSLDVAVRRGAQINGRHHAATVCGARTRLGVMSPFGAVGGARRLAWRIGHAAMVQTCEVALMASVAANVPRQLVGGGFDTVRGPLPPVQAYGAPTARPVLLVHGFCGTKSSWSLLAQNLSARGMTVDAVAYTSFGTSVEQLADRLVAEVKQILSRTGADKTHLVGHSLGGVIIAQAIADGRLSGQVDTVVTLGSPFGGSPWASLLPFGEIARALREGSPLLRRLASAPLPDGVRWLAFTAKFDVVVPGLRSVPINAEVETITVGDVGHNGMLLSPNVVRLIVEALPACDDALPASGYALPA